MNNREEYFQAKMNIAKELSKGTNMEEVVLFNALAYDRFKDDRCIEFVNALMRHEHGKGWCRRKCGINQHGVWVK